MAVSAAGAAASGAAGASWMSTFAPYASAGLNMLGSLFNSSTSSKNTKRMIRAQAEENEKAFLRNVEMWNKENEYNRPANQVQRFIEAGLNPNLAYGSLDGNSANSSPVAVPNDMSGIGRLGSPVGAALQAANLSQVEKTRAETENIRQNTEKQKQETEGQRLENIITDIEAGRAVQRQDLEIQGLQLDLKNKEKSAEVLDKQLDEMDAKITELNESANFLRAQAETEGSRKFIMDIEARWKEKEIQAIIQNYAAMANLSFQQANDIVKTQFYRLTNISADSALKYANVHYVNAEKELAQKQGFVIEQQGEKLRIENTWNNSGYHKFMKGTNEFLENAYLLTGAASNVMSVFKGGVGAAVPTIQPLSKGWSITDFTN